MLSFKTPEGGIQICTSLVSLRTHARVHPLTAEITWCITSAVVGSKACFNFHYSRKGPVTLKGDIMGRDGERGDWQCVTEKVVTELHCKRETKRLRCSEGGGGCG